jgi:hypothetical protein
MPGIADEMTQIQIVVDESGLPRLTGRELKTGHDETENERDRRPHRARL